MVRYGVNLEAIRCRVRQRTVQYELLDINRTLELTRIDWVDEVVSPITGLLSPVEKAIKAGWLVSDESGDYYVDTEAEQRIPLHMAVSKGLVRLRSPDKMDISNTDSFDSRSLLIIERITCTWCPVRIISYLDTLNKVRCTINEALQNGWIELKTGEPLILDRATQRWITTEEAAGRGVVQIVPIDASECYHDPLEETYSFRVFRIVAVRPGGEPNRWLEPAEAVRLGLFNWQTGEVASEWDEFVTEREQIEPSWDEPGQLVPTKWLSLLEARKARWVRLRAVTYPNEIVQKQANTPLRHSSHRILSTHVHLVAPRSIFVGPSPEGDNVSSSSIRSRSGIISPVSISSVSCNQWPSNGMSVQPSGSTACASTASSRAKPLRSAQNPEKWSSTFSYRLRTREIQKHSSRSVQRIYRSFVPERSNRLLVERDPIDSAA